MSYAVILGCIGQGHPPRALSQEQAVFVARHLARLCEGSDYAASATVISLDEALPLMARWRQTSAVRESLRPEDGIRLPEAQEGRT